MIRTLPIMKLFHLEAYRNPVDQTTSSRPSNGKPPFIQTASSTQSARIRWHTQYHQFHPDSFKATPNTLGPRTRRSRTNRPIHRTRRRNPHTRRNDHRRTMNDRNLRNADIRAPATVHRASNRDGRGVDAQCAVPGALRPVRGRGEAGLRERHDGCAAAAAVAFRDVFVGVGGGFLEGEEGEEEDFEGVRCHLFRVDSMCV